MDELTVYGTLVPRGIFDFFVGAEAGMGEVKAMGQSLKSGDRKIGRRRLILCLCIGRGRRGEFTVV